MTHIVQTEHTHQDSQGERWIRTPSLSLAMVFPTWFSQKRNGGGNSGIGMRHRGSTADEPFSPNRVTVITIALKPVKTL